MLGDGSLYKTHAPQLESGGRANVTVELRQDKLEEDPAWREELPRRIYGRPIAGYRSVFG